MENILFCMQALAKTMKPSELQSIQRIVLLITNLGDEHIALRIQSTKFILSISRLLGDHGDQVAEIVKNFMAYLLSGLKNNKLVFKISCHCFYALCEDCPGVLAQVIYSEENLS